MKNLLSLLIALAALASPAWGQAGGGTSPSTGACVGALPGVNCGTFLSGNATGTTGAVVGTLTAVANRTAYLCGFNVSAIGGTAAIGPVTVAGLSGGSQVYQGSSTATGAFAMAQNFAPACIPASAPNINITITTTADGTASAVDVNAWGFLF
jgi:hypothetical protein